MWPVMLQGNPPRRCAPASARYRRYAILDRRPAGLNLLAGLDRTEGSAGARERADETGAFTGLVDHVAMPVNSYSDGMRFRLGFGAWTGFEPDILVADEWIAAGDRAFLDKAYRRIEALADGVGIVVLASHDAALVRRMCRTAVLLEEGRVKASGAVGDVLDALVAAEGAGGR